MAKRKQSAKRAGPESKVGMFLVLTTEDLGLRPDIDRAIALALSTDDGWIPSEDDHVLVLRVVEVRRVVRETRTEAVASLKEGER